MARRLWAGGPVSFDGRFATVPDLELQPGPVHTGGPPVWVGGRSPAAVRRAGRFADVWLPYMYTPEQLARSLVDVREEAERAGRDPSTVRGAVLCWGAVSEDGAAARQDAIRGAGDVYQQDFSRLADRYLLSGTPEDVVARAVEYSDAGADWLIFAPVEHRRSSVVPLFARDVLPHLQRGTTSAQMKTCLLDRRVATPATVVRGASAGVQGAATRYIRTRLPEVA